MNFKQDGVMEEFFSSNALPATMVAAQAKLKLREYRPDPATGKQQPGTLLRFGLSNLDAKMSMLRRCFYLVAARPRTGKTAFAMQVVTTAMQQLADSGRVVVIFSAEMDGAALQLREACAIERLAYWDMVQGKLAPEEYERLERRLDTQGRQRFYLDETSAPTIEHMLEQLQAIVENGKRIGLVVFDYLELAGEFGSDEVKRIAKISRGLKSVAKKFDCPVLALGQLNRDIEKSKDKQPGLSDLMYGGEREPDGIVLLHRPWLQDTARPKELVEAHVIKHRHGPGGMAILRFDEQTMRFQAAAVVRTPIEQGT